MSNRSHPITLVLADDHACYREGFKILLKQIAQKIHVIGEASNGQELITLVEQQQPQMVITDIKMPVMDGIEATRIITQKFTSTGVICLSMSEDKKTILEMYAAGAKGYLVKDAESKEMVEAIYTVSSGQSYISTATSNLLASIYDLSKDRKKRKDKSLAFSEKEIKIIELICRQFTTKEIAKELFLSTRTVDDYRYRIQEKTNSRNMVGVAMYAVKNGIVND